MPTIASKKTTKPRSQKPKPAANRALKKAPQFSLPDRRGQIVKLSEVDEPFVVLYFYPKDNTPGCTLEAKGFQRKLKEFAKRGAAVIGISGGDEKSKEKFCKAHSLKFPLLSDSDFSVATRYRSYGEKKFMGRTYNGILRNTYILDSERNIVRTFTNVKPEGHPEEVLAALDELAAE